jgi:4-hydroxy-tetrahydrodipicolinate synthase
MFKGSLVALITPFKDGKVDEPAFQRFVEWQIEQGTHGLVPCGTTGESPTLSHDEHKRVVELCIEAAAGRVPVIAGAGSNNTAEAIDLTQHAKKAGADGVLVVTPYYNRPTQEGLYQHFKAVNDCADIPIIIYNIPPRSVVDMSVETMARLSKLPNIIGVKDATTDLARPSLEKMACGDDFVLLSGEDGTAIGYLAQGGVGCISVTANVAPKLCSMMHEAWQQSAIERAQQINMQLMPLHEAMFYQRSPAGPKYGAHLLGFCSPETRLPMTPAEPKTQEVVRQAMVDAGLL